jgi:hypothetical protein
MTELRYVQLRAPTREEQARYAEVELRGVNARGQVRGAGGEPADRGERNRSISPPSSKSEAGVRRLAGQDVRLDLQCHPRYSQPTQSSWEKIRRALRAAWQQVRQRVQYSRYAKRTSGQRMQSGGNAADPGRMDAID